MKKMIVVFSLILAGCGSGSPSVSPAVQPGQIGGTCLASLDRSAAEARNSEERAALLASRADLKCKASEAQALAFVRGGL